MRTLSTLSVVGPKPKEEQVPLFKDILANLKSGITVGLVNLPLSVSLAIAAGATPEMGALSATWGGIVGGLANGSHFSLIAPTGGLSGVLSNYAEEYGRMCLPILALCCSIISILAWLLNLHHFLTIIPQCGMVGFKLGIGTIIALNQLNFALGLNPAAIDGWESHSHFYERVYESLRHAGHTKFWNPIVFLVNMLPLIYLVKYAPPKVRLFPWHMVFVGLGMAYGAILDANDNPMDLLLLKDRFDISPYLVGTSSNANSTDPAFYTGVDEDKFSWGGVIVASFSVSIIAILETQIAAKILDGVTGTAFDSKREVLGTAVTNLFAGLAGGLPICGAMARMTLNANCGARSRTSIVINGFTVLIIMFALMPLFKYVPQPVIGAVLVPVAIGMIKFDLYVHYWRVDKPSLLICMITWAVCVFIDPTYAILVAILFGLLRVARNDGAIAPSRWATLLRITDGARLRVYQPLGKWDYTNSVTHKERIREARLGDDGQDLALSMHDVFLVDIDGLDALKSLANSEVPIAGLQENVRAECAKQGWFHTAKAKGLILDHINDLAADQIRSSKAEQEGKTAPTSPDDSAPNSPDDSGDDAAQREITIKEVRAAQAAWANAIKAISKAYLEGGDYVQVAADAAGELYGYGETNVLFKPTKAAKVPFRRTDTEAMSYFVGGGVVEDGYDEDAGFAINGGKGWKEVRFDNHGVSFNGDSAVAMGSYYFTCATTGEETRVEYSFGYKKIAAGKVRIFLHHSSVPYGAGAAPTPPKLLPDITMSEVKVAQESWANAIQAISKAYLQGGDYVQVAAEAAGQLYGYGHSDVLFKPTKAKHNPFRPTGDAAMSYFVGGSAVDSGFAEDKGFAINGGKGWKEVRFDNHQVALNGNTAVAMGSYYFTCATTGEETRVEYSFGYKKNADGKVRIFLHHSSVPYDAPASPQMKRPKPPAPTSSEPPTSLAGSWSIDMHPATPSGRDSGRDSRRDSGRDSRRDSGRDSRRDAPGGRVLKASEVQLPKAATDAKKADQKELDADRIEAYPVEELDTYAGPYSSPSSRRSRSSKASPKDAEP